MNKIIRRLLPLIMVVILSSANICVLADSDMYLNETKYVEAATALNDLGFISGYSEGDITIDRKMSRIEYLTVISKLFGNYFYTTEENVFTDITDGSEYAAIANSAYVLGLVTGNEFRPADYITFEEAVTISVRALGYNKMQNNMSFPTDYMMVASSVELLDDIANKGENFSVADAYVLIYNTMKADVVEDKKEGKNTKFVTTPGKTLLSIYHQIYFIEGQMTANSVTGITSDRDVKDGMEIVSKDGTVVLGKCDPKYNELIGMNINAFYSDINGDIKILTASLNDEKLDLIEIKSDEFEDFDEAKREISYYEYRANSTVKKLKEVEIPVTADWIYNGQYVENIKENVFPKLHDIVNYEGELNLDKIQLADLDNDGEIDLVKVDMYKTMVVDYVGTTGIKVDWSSSNHNLPSLGEGYIGRNNIAYDAVIADYNGIFNLDLTDETKTYYMHLDDLEIDITDIPQYAVLSVSEGMGYMPYVNITVSISSTEGIISAKDGEKFKMADGTEYTPVNSPLRDRMYDTITMGKKYRFMLDKNDKIAGFIEVANEDDELKVGFVLNAGYDKDTYVNTFSIYCPSTGEDGYKGILTLEAADRPVLNNTRLKAETSLAHLKGQLIRYQLDSEGKIKVIESAEGYEGGNALSYFIKDSEARNTALTGKRTFKYGSNIFYNQSIMDATLGINEKTTILKIPLNYENREAWEVCSQMSLQEITTEYHDKQFIVEGYVTDEMSIICDVLIMYTTDDMQVNIFKDASLIMVDKIVRMTDEDDEPIIAIRGCDKNGPRYFYCTSDKLNVITSFKNGKYESVEQEADTIHKGDIIMPDYDELGRIRSLMIVHSGSGETEFQNSDALLTANGDKSFRFFTGTVERVEYPFMRFKDNVTMEEYVMSVNTNSGSYVVIYDTQAKEARLGSYLDLMSGRGEAVVLSRYGQSTAVYIYI